MRVEYEGKKLESNLSSEKKMRAKYGADVAKAIARRIKTLESASNFAELLPPIPGKWHPLDGDRTNHWAASLSGNWRIVVRAEDAEEHQRQWGKVTRPVIVEIEDYHNKRTRR